MLAFLLFSVCFSRLVALYKKLPQARSYHRQSLIFPQHVAQNRVILRKPRTNIHCPIVFGTYHFDLAKLVEQDIKIEDEFKNGLGGMNYYEMSFCGDTPTACVGVTGATFGGLVKRDMYGNCIGNYGSWDGDWDVGGLHIDHVKGMLGPMAHAPGINPQGFSITITNGQVCGFSGHIHSRTEFNFVCDEGSDLATGTIAVFALDDCLHVVLVPTKGACTEDGMPMRPMPGVPSAIDPYSNFGGGFSPYTMDSDNWEHALIPDNDNVPTPNFYHNGGGFGPTGGGFGPGIPDRYSNSGSKSGGGFGGPTGGGITDRYSNSGGNSFQPNPHINGGGNFNQNGNGAGVNSNNGNGGFNKSGINGFNNVFSNNNNVRGNQNGNGLNNKPTNSGVNASQGGGNQNSGSSNNHAGNNSNNNNGGAAGGGTNNKKTNNSGNNNTNGNSSGSQVSTSGTSFNGTYSGDATCTHTPVPTCHGNVSRMKVQLSIQDCDRIEILINTGNAMYTGNAHGSHCTKTDIQFDFTAKVVKSEIIGSMYLHKYNHNLQGQLDVSPFDSSSWRLELSLLDINRVLKRAQKVKA